MAARTNPKLKNNQFWRQRAKHGRDAIFNDPQKLWDSACEYFDWIDNNPLEEEIIEKIKVNGMGEAIERVDVRKMRAYSWRGLALFLGCNSRYFNEFRESKTCKEVKGFSEIISRIEDVIYTQKFEGAASGLLNPSIIARDLQLRDNSDVTSGGKAIAPTIVVQSQQAVDDLAKLKDM